ncbi:hypothetical protein GCM10007913_34140 [Devosia yakushimensis]|uniref:Uncharacterized protein n=2 Tax=Devosia yakushimensis TaxID=470028 RepID=A0ABQ5UHI1_9HYPH|nr:hypothetical protein GCM10007913_34140 [Devosia yakushimensis]
MVEEFPGLAATGIKPIGRFGIGFFSVFMLGDVVNVISRRHDDASSNALKLTFGNGLASRPILSPATSSEAPKLGGTIVEIKLKGNPNSDGKFEFITDRVDDSNMFSTLGRYDVNFSSLEELVEYLVPASEVTLCVVTDAGATAVVTAGDWLTISAMALAKRTRRSIASLRPDVVNTLTCPISDVGGDLVGRAALWPSYGSSDRGGVLTAGGFRIQAVPHLLGIIRGEVQTAARDSGRAIVSLDILKPWAGEQSTALSKLEFDSGRKALSAEIILECGADIRSLPIISRGGVWYNMKDFAAAILTEKEILIHVGDVEYDEDDSVPESSFDAFEPLESIFLVPTLSGSITGKVGRYRSRPSHLFAMVRAIIDRTWKDVEETDDHEVVGHVNYTDIIRSVYIFQKAG